MGDNLSWTRDAKYVYGHDPYSNNPVIFRVNIPAGTMERVASLRCMESSGVGSYPWFGLAPDESPIISRGTGENEIFSVSYQMP